MFSSPFSNACTSTPVVCDTRTVSSQPQQTHSSAPELPAIQRAVSVLSTHLMELDDGASSSLFDRLGSLETAHQINRILDRGDKLTKACLQDKLRWADTQREALKQGVPLPEKVVLTPAPLFQ
ncbi:MAG TPA: hypothetical protein VGE55_03580 [Limnobacter sp.]|uniref:hypothetical protein n=1 Tax=Limnobacter sp. TaxID=2003368 RepID=UPI002ED7AC49